MNLVIDTNVLVAGVRSRAGASNPLIIEGFRGRFRWYCSVPLFFEYEDVLTRAEFLLEAGLARAEVQQFLTDLAGTVAPVDLHFLWRPQLRDAGDEMVLETAVNAGADAIVTYNLRDFAAVPERFGIHCLTPAEALERLNP